MSPIQTRITRNALAAALLFSISTVAIAGTVNEIKGLAIKGYDPVAYFSDGKPVLGSPKYRARHEGATFRFASPANRELFMADPARYTPAYGGFCAYGTSEGYKAGIDPAAFTIADGRLFLNYDLKVREEWAKDIPGRIAKADKNWPTVARTKKVAR